MQVADSSSFPVSFSCASPSITSPSSCTRAATQGLELLPSHQHLAPHLQPTYIIGTCKQAFSHASQDELPKAPDPGATPWFKVISWCRQLESRFPMFSSGLFGSCC